MTCAEVQELITALIDGQLTDPERGSLERHVQECPHCQFATAQERHLKETMHRRADQLRAPVRLRERILSDRRIFPAKSDRRKWWDNIWPQPRFVLPAFTALLLLALALPAYFRLRPTNEPIGFAALEIYDRLARGDPSDISRSENPDQLVEQLTHAVGGHFHPMGYDLSAVHLRPVAGAVQEIRGRKLLVTVYRGPGGSLICYTFLGSEEDAPTGSARFFDQAKNVNFYAYSRGGLNAVFHREGDVICILASEMPMDELLALAKTKARSS
jgi:mycothiol system anti-sigma-R factor